MAFLAPTMSKVLNLPQYNRVPRWIFKIGGNYRNLNIFWGEVLDEIGGIYYKFGKNWGRSGSPAI